MSQSHRPTVSVILPVYNARAYIKQAVTSIQQQTLTNWELLIIDDGSTDGTRKILQKIAQTDSRIKLILNAKNLGMAKSLNKLIPMTRGKYIARMDADDISLPERFASQVQLLDQNRQLVACGGHEYIINSQGDILGQKKFPTNPTTCRNIQLLFMAIQPPILMIRGSVMRRLRYDTQGDRNGDDISLYFKLLQHGELGNVDEIIFQYRVREDSTTHANVKKAFWMSFGVRVEAISSGIYKPHPILLLAFGLETLLVLFVPGKGVKWLFELLRHRPTFAFTNLQPAKAS